MTERKTKNFSTHNTHIQRMPNIDYDFVEQINITVDESTKQPRLNETNGMNEHRREKKQQRKIRNYAIFIFIAKEIPFEFLGNVHGTHSPSHTILKIYEMFAHFEMRWRNRRKVLSINYKVVVPKFVRFTTWCCVHVVFKLPNTEPSVEHVKCAWICIYSTRP